MARAPRYVCDSCGSARGQIGAPFCEDCGRPTPWASHDERTEYEVRQWRRERPGVPAGRTARGPAQPAAPPVAQHMGNAVLTPIAAPMNPIAPAPRPVESARSESTDSRRDRGSFASSIKRALTWIKRLFGASMIVPLDRTVGSAMTTPEPKPEPKAAEDRPHMTLVREEPPAPAPKPAAMPATSPAARKPPRKRPAPPTNKDMLKQALTVLTKVERRLEQLEQEVSQIPEAVRRPDSEPGARALGE